MKKKDELDPAVETQDSLEETPEETPEVNEETSSGRVFASISKASFLWSKFDPGIRGVPPITREGVEFDASHRNSVEREAERSGVKLTIEEVS